MHMIHTHTVSLGKEDRNTLKARLYKWLKNQDDSMREVTQHKIHSK